jgi:alpha-ketoglutarate-dependent taurine dioxygenase
VDRALNFESAEKHSLIRQVSDTLRATGWELITNFPDSKENEDLLGFASGLGTLRQSFALSKSIPVRTQDAASVIFDIREGYGVVTSSTPISQTGLAFDCHTDEYFMQSPARYILLLCCVPDPFGGGTSLIIHVDDLVRKLSEEAICQLQRPMFPSHSGQKAILQKDEDGWIICYNQHQIDQQISKRQSPIGLQARCAMDELAQVAASTCIHIQMRRGDCLILDNYRVLHGREAVPTGSIRHVKRVRIG